MSGYGASTAPPDPPANPEIFVRRLYKPKLFDQVNISASSLSSQAVRRLGSPSSPGPHSPAAAGAISAKDVPQSSFLLQSALSLPSEFGKIYLGETFTAYVSIVNTLPAPLLILDAQASLKSSRGPEVLLNNVGPTRCGSDVATVGLGINREKTRELKPGENIDVVVEHVLQELDWHYLAIKMEFIDGRFQETRPMMKRFKFKVYNPVAITAINRLLPNDTVLIQAQIKNITEKHASLLIEDVAFVAEDGFTVTRIDGSSQPEQQGNDNSPQATWDPLDCLEAFDRHVYLQPDDVAQYLFQLRRNDTYKGRAMPISAGTSLGQLRVAWRTTLGEPGMLLSPRVTCSTSEGSGNLRPVELSVEDGLPSELIQGQLYTARCALANNTDRDLRLQVQFHLESMQGVYVSGRAFQNAGLLPAHTRKTMSFQLLPLMAGLHDIKGLVIVDLVTAQEYEQGRLCEVLVVRRPPLAPS